MYQNNLRDNTYVKKFSNYVAQFQKHYNQFVKDSLKRLSSHLGNYGSQEKSLLTPGRNLSAYNLGGI